MPAPPLALGRHLQLSKAPRNSSQSESLILHSLDHFDDPLLDLEIDLPPLEDSLPKTRDGRAPMVLRFLPDGNSSTYQPPSDGVFGG